MQQEWWGCEFLDLQVITPLYSEQSKIFYLPIELITKTVDQKYILDISIKNSEYINSLEQSIKTAGLKLPGTIVVDSVRAKLQDGNHRYIASLRLGASKFPVKIEKSDGSIKSGGVKLQEIFDQLLDNAGYAC